MPGEVRTILDELTARSLRRLCRARDLGTGGDLHDKRSRLARSFRGQVEELIALLRREDMIAALGIWEFSLDDGREGSLMGLRGASKGELRKAMKRLFVDDWEPSPRQPQPCGEDFKIRVAWNDEDLDDEGDDSSDADAEHDDEDDEDDDSLDDDDDSEHDATEDGVDGDVEADFVEWMHEHIGDRGSANLLIKTLVNRLGRYRAEQRLSTPAVRDLGQVLARGGFSTDPDLTQLDRSPGIETRVRVSTRTAARPRVADWRPIPEPPPPPPPTAPVQRPHAPEPTPIISEFERSAAKLKFLVTVAGSVQRLGERERLLAVERVGHGAALNAADRVRLRAMAHQYASGHEDVNPTVRQLRVTLGEPERRQLLVDLRDLAPPTAELEELIAAFATDLAVLAAGCEPPPPPPRAAQPPPRHRPREEPRQQPPEDVTAGGVRQNAALDDIFDRGDDR